MGFYNVGLITLFIKKKFIPPHEGNLDYIVIRTSSFDPPWRSSPVILIVPFEPAALCGLTKFLSRV